ncbi:MULTISPECIES: porin [unclassified Thiocapsa]|uniref:porin n=1 Tax=unclassified Thiocapsa TaxID=2641286 RepID=UPI0035AD9F43
MTTLTLAHRFLITAVLGVALTPATPVMATNWIMLQGTEPATAPAYKAFGFVGIDQQQTSGSHLPAGPWQGQPMVLNQIPPKLEENSVLQFSYARLGVRGRLLDGKLNYWISPLAGDNAISANGTPNVKFTDVSLTLNRIPHARIRIGQFFMPGSEEGMTPVIVRDYINPTSVGSQMVNELPFDSDGLPSRDANDPTGPASGWRDTGIQVFDAFTTGAWEHTYALMAGTGTGLAIYNGWSSGQPEWHLYWSSELVFGGTGPFREGLKLFAWHQDGEREVRAGLAQTKQDFDRERYGLGATFRRGPWRAAAEWIKADGMIFNGTDGAAVPGAVSNNGNLVASYEVLPKEEADGWYLDGGYTLFGKLELRTRFDRLNRATASALTERRFDTLTLGLTYRFNKQVRVLADYQFRDFEAPGLPGSAVPNQNLADVDDLLAFRVWASF